jgi:hypothetical protein
MYIDCRIFLMAVSRLTAGVGLRVGLGCLVLAMLSALVAVLLWLLLLLVASSAAVAVPLLPL